MVGWNISGMNRWTPDRYMNCGVALALFAALLGGISAAVMSVAVGIVLAALVGAVAWIYLAIGIIGLGVRSARVERADHAG